MFLISFSTNVLTVLEEQYVYPMDSFIAEVGGALGLFLGFSFITVWDGFVALVSLSLKYRPK